MVSISISYEGQLHCRALHDESGTVLVTDAPKDNNGLGESFSPTDLVATALGSCILTIMDIKARQMGISLKGARAKVEKTMTAMPSRRIEALEVAIHIPHDIAAREREILERTAHTCPVHQSLHPDMRMPINFTWGV